MAEWVRLMSPERRASCEASQEKGFRRIEENIARKPAMRRALSSLEENTLIRTQQIWLADAERNVSPTRSVGALTDETINEGVAVVEPPPLVLPTFHLTETQRKALPEGWPPVRGLAARLEAACTTAPETLKDTPPVDPAPDCHACPHHTQGAQGEAQDASAENDDALTSDDALSLVIHDSRFPERTRGTSEPAAERPATIPSIALMVPPSELKRPKAAIAVRL